MKIVNERQEYATKGPGDLINITADLSKYLGKSSLVIGNMTVFVQGSTAGITTFEYEPGLIRDVRDFYDRVVP